MEFFISIDAWALATYELRKVSYLLADLEVSRMKAVASTSVFMYIEIKDALLFMLYV